jgi:hypothetical protein
VKGDAGQLLAAVGGAGLVYLAGGILIRAEVHRSGLPTDEVIAAIPREKLIVIGIKGLLAPAAGIALAVVAVAALLFLFRRARRRQAVVWLPLAAAGASGCYAAHLSGHDTLPVQAPQWGFVILAALVAGAVISLFPPPKLTHAELPATLARAWTVLLLAYVVVFVAFIWSQPIQLPPAIAELRLPDATETGYLVSQTSDAIYLATGPQKCEDDAHAKKRFHRRQLGPLLVIARDRLVRLSIGHTDSTNVRPSARGDSPQPAGFLQKLCPAPKAHARRTPQAAAG